MDNNIKYLIVAAIGFLIGLFVYDRFFVPESTSYETIKIETDTTHQHYKTKYQLDSVKWTALSDSISLYIKKYQAALKRENVKIVHDSVFIDKPFEAPLRRYSDSEAHLYGNMRYSATVAGALLDMEIYNDFRIPTITNTVTKEVRTVFKPSGLYGTAGFRAGDEQLSLLVGATYLKDKSMIFYNYDLRLKTHQVGVGVKVLGR